MKSLELHEDRLATTDEKGHRVQLFVADVRGRLRRRRAQIQFVLMLVFLSLPWIKVDGRQFICLNIVERKFDLFGISLRAHHAPLLFLVLATAAFGLFFVTSVWGRIWCGWACPQTVFVDFVFRQIERWTEGSALARRELARSPWTWLKFRKVSTKWILFIVAAAVITHSFLAFFVGGDRLLTMISSSPRENWASFLFILVSTSLLLFDFAWFREQFCIIVCPYGRLQSVLMDSNSLIVGYNSHRGEPRRGEPRRGEPRGGEPRESESPGRASGDCVNCYRCVQVCPTGVDIRRGLQMECIACTACIDACDEVMTKTNKPKGLIQLTTLNRLEQRPSPAGLPPRSMLYLALTLVCLFLFIGALARIESLETMILRAPGPPYIVFDQPESAPTTQSTPPGTKWIINRFVLEVTNHSRTNWALSASLDSELESAGAQLLFSSSSFLRAPPAESSQLPGPSGEGPSLEADTSGNPVVVAGQTIRVDVAVRFPIGLLRGGQKKTRLRLAQRQEAITDASESQQATTSGATENHDVEVILVGPL